MALPLNKRDYDLFLSHSHKDFDFVKQLDDWLRNAGLKIWFDYTNLPPGANLASDLQTAIEKCRGILLVVSEDSMQKRWVINEYNAAMDEQSRYDGYKIIPIRVNNGEVDNIMRGMTWIDVPEPKISSQLALNIIRSMYPWKKNPNPESSRDVYISCSWHENDKQSSLAVCKKLRDVGFRLIGDSKDQKGFEQGKRIQQIIESCGAFVGIIPYRNVSEANINDKPYKYFLEELDIAEALGIDSIVIADPLIRRVDKDDKSWLRMETKSSEIPESVSNFLDRLWDDWQDPKMPHYVFCATDLDPANQSINRNIRDLITLITGMVTIIGTEIKEAPLQLSIKEKINKAFVVLADITKDNVNTCIEASIALNSGKNLEIISEGTPRSLPFMLRQHHQLLAFKDEVELIGIIHRIFFPFRRRIINSEL